MLMKSLSTIFLTLIIWLGLPSCIKCPNFWKVDGIDISFYDAASERHFSFGDIQSDSLEILVSFVQETYGEKCFFSPNAAYAWSCGDPILENSYIAIDITSNADFNEVPAGASLKEKIFLDDNVSIDSIIPWMLQQGQMNRSSFTLKTKEKPDSTKHVFTISIMERDSTEITGSSGEINWF